jgi:hypothetical protein
MHEALGKVRALGEWFNTTPGEAVSAVRAAAGAIAQPLAEHGALPLFTFKQCGRAGPTSQAPSRSHTGLLTRVGRLWRALATRSQPTRT